MSIRAAVLISAMAASGLLALAAPAMAQQKTAKECAEYTANKPTIQGAGTLKKDFIAACRTGTETIPTAGATPMAAKPTAMAPAAPATDPVKTAKVCEAEYAANKDPIKSAGTLKKDFMTACRAGTETIPAAASAPPPMAPAPAPAPKPMAAPAKPMAPASGPAAATGPTGANEYATDSQAKGRCPAGTVVWVNLKSKVYHFAGSRN